MLVIPIFNYFLILNILDFVVLVLNYFPRQKKIYFLFCSYKISNI